MKSIQLQKGQKFGRLTIINLDHIKEYINPKGIKSNKEFYLCKCDCGNNFIAFKECLKKNKDVSCGCLAKEKSKNNNFKKHGLYWKNKRLNSILSGMKKRCYNNKNYCYKRYGGKGIKICDEWLDKDNGFVNFYNWSIANGYEENLTIDRIDNNGNYEPSNCRWADFKTQCRNRTSNHLITYNGETHCLIEWCEKLNMSFGCLFARIERQKLSIEEAFNKPVRNNNKGVKWN